jgi:hypothetical protein
MAPLGLVNVLTLEMSKKKTVDVIHLYVNYGCEYHYRLECSALGNNGLSVRFPATAPPVLYASTDRLALAVKYSHQICAQIKSRGKI